LPTANCQLPTANCQLPTSLRFYESRYLLSSDIADWHEGQAEDVFAHTHMLEHGFDAGGTAFGKQEVDAGEQLVVQLAGFIELVDEGEVNEVGHVFGEAVGRYGNDAFHAYGHLCYHEVVVAGEHGEVVGLALQQLQALGYVAAGLLDGDDAGAFGGEAQYGGRQ